MFGGVGTAEICAKDNKSREEKRLERERLKEEKRLREEEKKHQKELKQQEKKAKKEQQVEANKKNKEELKAEKRVRKEERRRRNEDKNRERELKEQEEKAQEEKAIEAKKQKKDELRNARKEEKRRKREERKKNHEFKKSEEGKQAHKEEMRIKDQQKQERREKRKLGEQEKKKRSKERCRMRKARRLEKNLKIEKLEHDRVLQKNETVRYERNERTKLMGEWKQAHRAQADHDLAAGKYADLYKFPAWPTYAAFYPKKDFFNLSFNYKYATDAYDSDGGSSETDVTSIDFGCKNIIVKDILLASKLVKENELINNEDLTPPGGGGGGMGAIPTEADYYLKYLADERICFNGRAEQYGLSFDFSRYIISNNVAIGLEVPVLYKRHRLRMDMHLSDNATRPDNNYNNGAFGLSRFDGIASWSPNVFLRRYGVDPARFVKDLLHSKCINELGGSAMGLGDIAIFANAQFNSVYFEKLVTGLRIQFPTGKKASQYKLWAPDLGNGGFPEIEAFGSVLFSYQKYLNPHVMAQFSFSLRSHVDRRVPRKVARPQVQIDNPAEAAPLNRLEGVMAFGDRVDRAGYNEQEPDDIGILGSNNTSGNVRDIAIGFCDFDSCCKGFGDVITNVKMTKGPEFKFRIGNMFERFISKRGFLDIFYDFRGKLKDDITALDETCFNVGLLRRHSSELEHRIGLNYSQQFDLYTRLNIGALYTFAGMNIPKTFEFLGSVNYSF